MKLKSNLVPFDFPFVKKFKSNSSILKIIKAFFSAFFISNSIYLSIAREFGHLQGVVFEFLSPLLAIYGLVLLLRSDGRGWFMAGFFLSLLWFYWIALSSVYYGLHYIIPLELLGIGLFYAVLFRLCYALRFDFLRLAALFCLPFIHFLGFDWLNWGVLSVYGTFDASWRGVLCIFLMAYFYYEGYISRYYKIFIVLTLFFVGMQYKDVKFSELESDFKLINTQIDEASKFEKDNVAKNADFVVDEILAAISEGKQLIVFPESSFAFEPQRAFGGMYFELLREFSREITIVIGAPYSAQGKYYNSAYVFSSGEVKILHKHYLVAFGEETSNLPLIGGFVRKYLLPNMIDYTRGEPLNQYFIGQQLITNAICYEVTKEALYENSDIIIAISNNAWFDNLVEPALQRLLITFYASKYGVSVYHATNAKHTGVILPKKSLYLHFKEWIFSENLDLDENSNLDENSSLNLDENSSFDKNSSENLNENLGFDGNLSFDRNFSLENLNLGENLSENLRLDGNSSLDENLSENSDENLK